MQSDMWKRTVAVARHSASGAIQQPVLLATNGTGVLLFLLVLVGVGVRTEGGAVAGVRFLGLVDILDMESFARRTLPEWCYGLSLSLLTAAALFSTLRWNRVMRDPVRLILLGGGVTRRGFLAGEFLGSVGAFGFSAALQIGGCAALLAAKGAEVRPVEIAQGILLLTWWFSVLFAWGFAVTMFVDHLLSRLVAMVVFCLVIGTALGGIDLGGRPILEMIALLLPPAGRMGEIATASLLGRELPPIPLIPLLIVPLLLLFAAERHFRREDLQEEE